MQAGGRVRLVFEGQCIVNVLHLVAVDDATLVHQSMPLKLLLTERKGCHRCFPSANIRSFLSNSVCIYSMCANRMLSPSVLIGPREDESVSVMRLEKKSSIHNLTECVCDAMQHGKCSPCSFFSFFYFLTSPSMAILSGRSMSLVFLWDIFLQCMDVLRMEVCQGNWACRKGFKAFHSAQLHLHNVQHSQAIEFQHLLFCTH